jgi:hypothetical protein
MEEEVVSDVDECAEADEDEDMFDDDADDEEEEEEVEEDFNGMVTGSTAAGLGTDGDLERERREEE